MGIGYENIQTDTNIPKIPHIYTEPIPIYRYDTDTGFIPILIQIYDTDITLKNPVWYWVNDTDIPQIPHI